MEFPRQEYWSWLPFPTPEDFPDPGIEPQSSASQVDSLPTEPPRKPICVCVCTKNFFSWRRKLTEGRLQVSDLLSISYITLNKLLFCFMHHPSSFLYWPVEEITWVKWALFLEQILYLFQTFYYPLANHLIMRTAKVRERMSNSKNLLCLSVSLLHM